jgi:hypothetical protein
MRYLVFPHQINLLISSYLEAKFRKMENILSNKISKSIYPFLEPQDTSLFSTQTPKKLGYMEK